MSDHTYIDMCNKTFELENWNSIEENNESDVDDFIDTLDELIIAYVQSYPHLYNKGNANYKDNLIKEKSWEEIAKTCNISGMFLKIDIYKAYLGNNINLNFPQLLKHNKDGKG